MIALAIAEGIAIVFLIALCWKFKRHFWDVVHLCEQSAEQTAEMHKLFDRMVDSCNYNRARAHYNDSTHYDTLRAGRDGADDALRRPDRPPRQTPRPTTDPRMIG